MGEPGGAAVDAARAVAGTAAAALAHSMCLRVPRPVEVVDPAGAACAVSGRGLLNGEPSRLSVDGGPWQPIVAWAGPWTVTERWWSVRRRRARFQVVTADGAARLLCTERARWWVEALYD